jgi:hypothetical protein
LEEFLHFWQKAKDIVVVPSYVRAHCLEKHLFLSHLFVLFSRCLAQASVVLYFLLFFLSILYNTFGQTSLRDCAPRCDPILNSKQFSWKMKDKSVAVMEFSKIKKKIKKKYISKHYPSPPAKLCSVRPYNSSRCIATVHINIDFCNRKNSDIYHLITIITL